MRFTVDTVTIKSVLKALVPFARMKSSAYFNQPLIGKLAIDAQDDRVLFHALTGNSSAEYALIDKYHNVDNVETGFIAVEASQLQEVINVVKADRITIEFDSDESIIVITDADTGEKVVQLSANDADEASESDVGGKPEFSDEDTEIVIDSEVFKDIADGIVPSSNKNPLWGDGVALIYEDEQSVKFVAQEGGSAFVLARTVNAEVRSEFDDIMIPVEFIKLLTTAMKEAGDGQLFITHNFEDAEKTTRLTLKQGEDEVIVLDVVIPQSSGYISSGSTRKALTTLRGMVDGNETTTVVLPLNSAVSEMEDAAKIGNIEPDYFATGEQNMEYINIAISAEDNAARISTAHSTNRYVGFVEADGDSEVEGDSVDIRLSHAKLVDLIKARFLGNTLVLNLTVVKNFNPRRPDAAMVVVLPEGVTVEDDKFDDNIGYGVVAVNE